MLPGDWSGFPFPRPSGEHKAMQVLYNHKRGYTRGESYHYIEWNVGVNKRFDIDHQGLADGSVLRAGGRALFPPYGYLDQRARENNEVWIWIYTPYEPRDFYGNVYRMMQFDVPDKDNTILAYVNILRRIRKLSSSDKQDQAVGQDITFDDADMFSQKMSPDMYPMEYKILEEREFLVPVFSLDGAEYFDSKDNFKLKNLKFERRPMWLVEAKILDKNYIYSKRIMLVDKETLILTYTEMHDQKGRLYRSFACYGAFMKPMGLYSWNLLCANDHIDTHSTLFLGVSLAAPWISRDDVNLKQVRSGK
jgi:hypothetical protein